MSFMDNFLDFMRLNGDDDDDDDYEFPNENYYDDDDDYEEPKKKPSRRETKAEPKVKEEPKKTVTKITPISKPQRKQTTGVGMEVCVIKPNAINEEIEITDTLLSGRTVLINLEGLDIETAQRIMDFTSGATYAMKGHLQKVSNYIFLATPNGVDISGDIQSLMDTFDSGNNVTL